MPSTIVAIMMDVKGNQNMHVNQNCLRGKPHHALSSPNPLDNDILKRNSSGLSDFSDYVDLVKRHLMYAVREEVEILKQQIGEMMDRIGQLEYENTVLRSEARPETLNKLLQPRLTQSSQNSVPNHNTSTVTATKLQQSTHPVSLPLQQVTQQST